jgi:hypothetical protein
MSKGKKLLNEDTVKRFMKLAGTEKLYEGVKLEEEELEEAEELEEQGSEDLKSKPHPPRKDHVGDILKTLEEQVPGEEEPLPGPPPEALEPDAGLGEPEADLGVPPEGEPAAEASPEVEDVYRRILSVIEGEAEKDGLDMDVEPGEPEGEPGEPGEEMPPPDFLPAAEEEEEEGLPPGLEEARRHAAQQELFMEELSRRVANRVKREHIVEQVTKRVARRLQGAKRRTKK